MEAALSLALRGLVKLRLEFGRSVEGWFRRWVTHQTVLLHESVVRLPGLPSAGVVLSPSCKRYYARLRLPLGRITPKPRRVSPVPHTPVPAFRVPLRRRVRGGCTS